MHKYLLPLVALTTLSLTAMANEPETLPSEAEIQQVKELIEIDPEVFREQTRNELSGKGQIIGIQLLPINRLFFVEAEHGTYLVTADGRFVIQGSITDVWHRTRITNLEEAKQVERTPLRNLNFDPLKELAALQLGNPDKPRQGIVFADPTSGITQQFVRHVLDNSNDYNFTLVLMPLIGGDAAADRAQRIFCATDRAQAIQDLADYTNKALGNMDPDCDASKLMLAVYMQELFRIQSLPHFIREDGFISEGLPEDLDGWLSAP